MINSVLLGFNLLLLILIWKFMLKKSILDHYRDQLFDLREEVREYFLERNISLDSSCYRNLRDLLNAHLRFTEKISFAKLIFMEAEVKSKSELQQYLKEDFERRFHSDDEAVNEYVSAIRERARLILFNYVVNSSGIVWILAVVLSPIVIFFNILGLIKRFVAAKFSVITDGLSSSFIKVVKIIISIQDPFGRPIRKDLLEEYSYKLGSISERTEYA